MATPKPTVVLAHGSWHSPEHYALLEANLQSHSYKTNFVWLPTMHYARVKPPLDPAQVTLLDDIAALRKAITEELSKNPTTDVVLVSHSSGTVPASAAIQDFDKGTCTKQGFENGIRAFCIMSGIIVPAGMTSLEWAGGQVPPTVTLTSIPDPSDSTKEITVSKPVPNPGAIVLFYHDLPDQEEAKHYADLCVPQIWAVNTTKIPFSGYKVPGLQVCYLVCEDDRALPPGFQRVMIENADKEIATAETEAHGQGAEHGSMPSHGGDQIEKFQKDSLAAIEESKAILEGVKTGKVNESAADGGQAKKEGREDHEVGPGTSKIQVTSIKSAHSPFLSRVEETAQWLRRSCGEKI